MNDLERLASIRDRVQYGIPPADVIGDVRFLLGFLDATVTYVNCGEPIAAEQIHEACKLPRRHAARCPECNASGEALVTNGVLGTCPKCEGRGYQ